jgi:hypothetical protein
MWYPSLEGQGAERSTQGEIVSRNFEQKLTKDTKGQKIENHFEQKVTKLTKEFVGCSGRSCRVPSDRGGSLPVRKCSEQREH